MELPLSSETFAAHDVMVRRFLFGFIPVARNVDNDGS
jgi:hypothetical protein